MKTFWKFAAIAAMAGWTAFVCAEESKPLDPVLGIYEGFWTAADGSKGRMTSQVRPIGGGKYEGFVAFYKAKAIEAAMQLKPASGAPLNFEGVAIKSSGGSMVAEATGSAVLDSGKLTGKFKGDLGEGTFEGALAHPKSPTLGARPRGHAKVLFDGKPGDGWSDFHWKITPEGAAVVTNGDIHAKDQYANFRLHVEFRTPFMPEAQGQARGNSGVYLQNKYEVQVLDSFGLFPLQKNDCGAIYSMKAPEGNACLAPGEWQTYDITFVQGSAARGEAPTISVEQNGIAVVEKFEVPKNLIEKGTTGADQNAGFLKLQDHGNPVEYRNIWVDPFFVTNRK